MKFHTEGETKVGYYLQLHEFLPDTLELVYYSNGNDPQIEDTITIKELLNYGKSKVHLSIGRFINSHLGSERDYSICGNAFEAIIKVMEESKI